MATRRKDGRWVASVTVRDRGIKKRLYLYARTENEANRLVEETLLLSEAPRKSYKRGTFRDFVHNSWAPRMAVNKSPFTLKKYDGMLRNHILPYFGDSYLTEIRYEDIQGLIDQKQSELGPKMRHEVLMLIRSILKFAVELGRLDRNPSRLVTTEKPPKRKVRIDLNPDYVAKLLNITTGQYFWMRAPIILAGVLGLRRGEVCGLLRSQINLDRRLIFVEEQLQVVKGNLERMKVKSNENGRVIPVPDSILDMLQNCLVHDTVYVVSKNGKPVAPNTVTKAMSKLCELAEIPKLTFHDLRALAATNLKSLGADPWTVMEILGHTTLDTTTIYAQSREVEKRAAIENLTQKLLSKTVVKFEEKAVIESKNLVEAGRIEFAKAHSLNLEILTNCRR